MSIPLQCSSAPHFPLFQPCRGLRVPSQTTCYMPLNISVFPKHWWCLLVVVPDVYTNIVLQELVPATNNVYFIYTIRN